MSTRIAIKEWSGVVEALGRGEQILMIRNYPPPVDEFLLYPTFSYISTSDPEAFNSKFQEKYRQQSLEAGEKTRNRAQKHCIVDIEYVAKVHKLYELTDQSIWTQLSKHFIWSTNHVAGYGKQAKNGTWIWVLRIQRLENPVEIGRISQGGPPSIYRHHQDIPTANSRPVIDDTVFGEQLREIANIISSATKSTA